jgi:DNA polymerase eta
MEKRKLSTHSTLRHYRTIALLDLDCFYAQVEHRRLNVPHVEPLAVQQWNGLIAVNYAARAKGIKRHCSPSEARELCPEVHLVHCATYAPGEPFPKYRQEGEIAYTTHKISLEPYRLASQEIFGILRGFTQRIQRASIDEAYLDLTDLSMQRMMDRLTAEEIERDWKDGPLVIWDDESAVIGPSEKQGWRSLQLKMAADIVAEIRRKIFDELGFTVSAGIANSKTVAKLVAGLNKPNKQTIIPDDEITGFFENLPFKSIRMLGGKLGKSIHETLEVEFAGELWKYSQEQLRQYVSEESAHWLYDIVRGVCQEEVTPGTIAKSMMAAKSFRPGLKTKEQVDEWLHTLSAEIFYRLNEDVECRWPKTLCVSFKTPDLDKARSCPFPPRSAMTSPTVIAAKASQLLWTEEIKSFPVFRMTVQAQGLEGEKDLQVLDKFFASNQESENTFQCEKCKMQIARDKRDEHSDWHVAMDLVKQDQLTQSKGVKRRQNDQPSIAKFFKKV